VIHTISGKSQKFFLASDNIKARAEMPKPTYNPEKIQRKKRIIGIISITLLLILVILSFIFPSTLRFYIVVPLALVIFGVAKLLLRQVGKTPV
jgi:hypothetical protein